MAGPTCHLLCDNRCAASPFCSGAFKNGQFFWYFFLKKVRRKKPIHHHKPRGSCSLPFNSLTILINHFLSKKVALTPSPHPFTPSPFQQSSSPYHLASSPHQFSPSPFQFAPSPHRFAPSPFR
jgi:hypothetical protein